MTTLADFLLARIAEDEATARAVGNWPPPIFRGVYFKPEVCARDEDFVAYWHPDRVLVDCKAKRQIVLDAQRTMHSDPLRQGDYWRGVRDTDEGYLRLLALPYADHPEFREEWRPGA